MATYPSVYSAFAHPTSTDRLNNPSHSDLHNATSSAVGQLEAVIGLAGDASTLGTILGDLRSPNSGGGGHVQTASKGGTGQTSFNKGDLLLGQSSSVIAKLAVSSINGQVLVADSSQSLGVKWSDAPAGTKVQINPSTVTVSSTTGQTAFASASVQGSILGASNGVRFTIPTILNTGRAANATTISLWYGANQIGNFVLPNIGNNTTVTGIIDGMIVGAGDPSIQSAYLRASLGNPSIIGYTTGTSSINSAVLQQLQVRAQNADVNSFVQAVFSEFDKIV